MSNDERMKEPAPQHEGRTATFRGIQLENLDKDTSLSHSRFIETNKGIEQLEALFDRDKASLTPEQFEQVSALSSVANFNYQVCNGGLDQYFANRMDKERPPFNEQDVKHLDKEGQLAMLDELLDFGREVYPEQELMNERLDRIIRDFDRSAYVEDEYVDEDYDYGPEMVVDAPHDFDTRYYLVNDYLETLMEGYAQYLNKEIDRSLDGLVQEAKERLKDKESREEPKAAKDRKDPGLER